MDSLPPLDSPPSALGVGLRFMVSYNEPTDVAPFSRHPRFTPNDSFPEAGPSGVSYLSLSPYGDAPISTAPTAL